MSLAETVDTHHGIPRVVVPEPGPVRARLVFRVGAADEPAHLRGVSHLVEHLVMRAVGRRAIEVNAHVGAWATAFEATGPVEAVTEFVEAVWRVLGALPDDPLQSLDKERAVLLHEDAGGSTSPVEESVVHRYGMTGPGVMWLDQVAVKGISASAVQEWARSRFVRGAAALVATAALEPDLSGGPVDGAARPIPEPVPARPRSGPVWVGDCGGTAVSLLLPAERGLDLAVGRLLRDAAEDVVRHERALAYEVGMDVLQVTEHLSEVAVYADCAPERGAEVAALLLALLRRMRDDGTTEAELAHERETTRTVWSHTPDALEVGSEWAFALLTGDTPRSTADRLADAEAVDAQVVGRVLADAWSSLQVLLPLESDPGLDGVAECVHRDEPVHGRRHRANPLAPFLPGARLGVGLSVSVVVGDEGLTLDSPEEVLTVRWDAVAVVLDRGDGLTVIGLNGNHIHLPDGTFLSSRRLRREVETRVEADLVVDYSGPDDA